MSNFILAMVSIVYAIVCLTKEADQGICSISKPAENKFEKGAEGKRETLTPLEQKKLNLNH
jgi:hypothetical protein